MSPVGVPREEMPDSLLKGTHHGRIKGSRIAVRPVDAPKPRRRIEQAQGYALIWLAGCMVGVPVDIPRAVEDLGHFNPRLERHPLGGVRPPRGELPISQLPVSNEEVKVMR